MENLDKKQIIVIAIIAITVIGVIGYYIYTRTTNQTDNYQQINIIGEETITQNSQEVENTSQEIVVHIAGEVKKQGIVKIKEGARIADIIEKAEGLTENADITNVNLAYIVEDGQKITIPKAGQNANPIEENEEMKCILEDGGIAIKEENTNVSTTININKANQEELQTLDGIGESTANKIIEYRKQNGNFKKIEDIKNVPGIGEAKYETIKDKIKV